jgi:hypothetical protein
MKEKEQASYWRGEEGVWELWVFGVKEELLNHESPVRLEGSC